MCGLGKLNAAALDTTVACGYNGIDQHNLGLLPPIAGIDTPCSALLAVIRPIAPPIAGIDIIFLKSSVTSATIAPIAGIDTRPSRAYVFLSIYCPPSRGLIFAASGQLLNGGAPSTLFHPPSTPPLCVPLPTFRSGEAASAIRKRLRKIYLI